MSLPDLKVRYKIQNLHLAPSVLSDALNTVSTPIQTDFLDPADSLPKINEICMVGLGEHHR